MSGNRELGERLVAGASPMFKDFRVDFERISNGAGRLMERGEITAEARLAMFIDGDWDIRMPLQRRYVEAGAIDQVAHYHAKRFKLLLGRNTPWPDVPGLDALRLFAEHGRADAGLAMIRTYVDMQHARLKRDYGKRNPRGPRKDLGEGLSRLVGEINKAVAGAISDRKGELLRSIDVVAAYVEAHGGSDDRAWLEDVRRQLWMERRA